MRGSSPGRARDAYQRSGDFQAGHQKRGGRQKGTPNFFSADLKKALCEAADRIGYDGNGKDGRKGYFVWVAMHHPGVFAIEFLVRLLLWEDEPSAMAAERDRWARQYNGKRNNNGKRNSGKRTAGAAPSRPVNAAAADWTGRDDLVGNLMHVAVADPKSFCRLLGAACLTVPKNRRGRVMRAFG